MQFLHKFANFGVFFRQNTVFFWWNPRDCYMIILRFCHTCESVNSLKLNSFVAVAPYIFSHFRRLCAYIFSPQKSPFHTLAGQGCGVLKSLKPLKICLFSYLNERFQSKRYYMRCGKRRKSWIFQKQTACTPFGCARAMAHAISRIKSCLKVSLTFCSSPSISRAGAINSP